MLSSAVLPSTSRVVNRILLLQRCSPAIRIRYNNVLHERSCLLHSSSRSSYRTTTAHERPASAVPDDGLLASIATEGPQMMLILGKPGGGKGTISGKILRDFPQIHHVSSGDLLRSHVRQETALGHKAKTFMEQGKLVPDELMIELVMDDATPLLEEGKCLLLDGFPRTLEQAQALQHVVHIDTVINLDIPTDVIVERIADRWIHPPSGRVYSYSYKPPKVRGIDDITGEPLLQRDDDKPESVRTRLDAYDKVTSPLIQYYESLGVLKTFSGTMSDVIYPKVKEWLVNERHIR